MDLHDVSSTLFFWRKSVQVGCHWNKLECLLLQSFFSLFESKEHQMVTNFESKQIAWPGNFIIGKEIQF